MWKLWGDSQGAGTQGGGEPGSPGNPISAETYVPNSGVPPNFPGALEDHPGWINDGKPNGSCNAHPGGCKDVYAGSSAGCGPGGEPGEPGEPGDPDSPGGPEGDEMPQPADLPSYTLWGQALNRFG
jgi:hypothetical protein